MNAADERCATIRFARHRNRLRVDADGTAVTLEEQCARRAGLQERVVCTWSFGVSGLIGVQNAASVTGGNGELGGLALRRFVAFPTRHEPVLGRVAGKSASTARGHPVTK